LQLAWLRGELQCFPDFRSLEIQQSVDDEINDTEAGMFCVSVRVNLAELKRFGMRSKLRV
jgi:hypothetical protein